MVGESDALAIVYEYLITCFWRCTHAAVFNARYAPNTRRTCAYWQSSIEFIISVISRCFKCEDSSKYAEINVNRILFLPPFLFTSADWRLTGQYRRVSVDERLTFRQVLAKRILADGPSSLTGDGLNERLTSRQSLVKSALSDHMFLLSTLNYLVSKISI